MAESERLMRFSQKLEPYRVRNGFFASQPGEDAGAFTIPGPRGENLRIIASSGDPSIDVHWEHVSVSLRHRTPTWEEMCYVKSLFWDEEETVMQLHPPKSRWINNHRYCLHLWRPLQAMIPLPPDETVGNKSLGVLRER